METTHRDVQVFEDKEHAEEDSYVAARDRELIAQLHQQQAAEREQTLRELDRARCPRCGTRLRGRTLHEVSLDECPGCQGMWLDQGEVAALAHHKGEEWTGQFLQRLAHILTHPAKV